MAGRVASGRVGGVLRLGAVVDGVFFYRTTIGRMRRAQQDDVDGLVVSPQSVFPCPVCGDPVLPGDTVEPGNGAVHCGCGRGERPRVNGRV